MRLRILIVEDDPVQSALLAAFLRVQGYQVDTCENGLDGLRKGRLGWFHIVIMDYGLPEIDGLAAARLIGDYGEKRPIIIALSATIAALQAEAAASETVFDALIEKPWDPDTLLQTIARCCAERRAQSDRSAAIPVVAMPDAARGPTAIAPDMEPPDAVCMLVVDDDDIFRTVLAAAFGAKGYRVDTATQGLAALRMIGRSHYDIAILDYHLPEIDGLAIARLTHELVPGMQRPRLIGLTSSPEHLSEREAGSLSAFDDVILKSSDLGDVIARVELCLAYKQARPNPAGVNILQLMQATAAP